MVVNHLVDIVNDSVDYVNRLDDRIVWMTGICPESIITEEFHADRTEGRGAGAPGTRSCCSETQS